MGILPEDITTLLGTTGPRYDGDYYSIAGLSPRLNSYYVEPSTSIEVYIVDFSRNATDPSIPYPTVDIYVNGSKILNYSSGVAIYYNNWSGVKTSFTPSDPCVFWKFVLSQTPYRFDPGESVDFEMTIKLPSSSTVDVSQSGVFTCGPKLIEKYDYECKTDLRWDQLSYKLFGTFSRVQDLKNSNPHLSLDIKSGVIPSGTRIIIPAEFQTANGIPQNSVAQWRRQ